ncbi:FAD-binding protein [Aestuariimicrobium ganziense]|uniref:FAD-binding protein n=1 Tax=Aestuariimicrobium ganziense TaxID=2773677 RepID=UPI0019431F31|nr:FAD-binding protein [Aestuariimicrobium ganziense]
MAEWRNWADNVRAYAVDVHSPRDAEELSVLVKATAAVRRRLRPVGSWHSFNAIASPADQQVRLDRMSGVVSHDPATGRARVRAGTVLRDLSEELWSRGLGLPNLGDYDGQTLAGAVHRHPRHRGGLPRTVGGGGRCRDGGRRRVGRPDRRGPRA